MGSPGGGPLIKKDDYVRVDYTGYLGGFSDSGGEVIDTVQKALKGPAVKFHLGVGDTTGLGGTPASDMCCFSHACPLGVGGRSHQRMSRRPPRHALM